TVRNGGRIDAEKPLRNHGSNLVAEASIAGGSGSGGTTPVEEPRQDSRAVDAAVNWVARRAPRGAHADESLRAPVVASQEEIALAEQLRLELERKYLNEPG